MQQKINVCYQTASSTDWGGASRVLFTTMKFAKNHDIEPLVLLPNKGRSISLLKNLHIRYVIWGQLSEYRNPFTYFSRVIKAIRLFRNANTRILHINGNNYWRPAEIIAARILKIPIITHYHVNVKKYSPWLKYSSAIVAVSNYTANTSQPREFPKTVIHNVVDIERFQQARNIRRDLELSEDDIVFTFIGQIRDIKGIDLFIDLGRTMNDGLSKFLIVGECRKSKNITDSYTEERLHSKINGNKQIRYLGYRSDIENVIYSSDVIVVPSRWDEPFGLVNIEAGAAGKPVIASAIGGIPEIIRNGFNGYLFEPGKLEELISCANKLKENQDLRSQLGVNALAHVKRHFTDKPMNELRSLYEQLLTHS